MSEPENFVARWSRLKRRSEKGAADRDAEPARQAQPPPPPADRAGTVPESAAKRSPPAFDPATLPPIESIVEGTDIRTFLQSGVPRELTKAALRRAWSADPGIRDFMCLAENQWDFTDPTAIGGFGTLEATEDMRKLVAQAMGRIGEADEQLAEAAGRGAPGDVRRSTQPSERVASVAGPQEPGVPHESPGDQPTPAGSLNQQSPVDVAVRNDECTAKHTRDGSRRGHGSALPQ